MKKIKIKTSEESGKILGYILILICLSAKIFEIKFLPDKYFYDGKRILTEALTGYRTGDKGYDTAANFFSFLIRLLKITTHMEWAILLGIVGNILILKYVKKYYQNMYMSDMIFLISSLGLLNIYTFNVGKDIIQMIFLLPIIYVLRKDYNYKTKVIVTIIMFLGITLFLRTYYILVMGIYLVLLYLMTKKIEITRKKTIFYILMIGLVGVLGLYLIQIFTPELYFRIINIRDSINEYRVGSADAKTLIVNAIPNSQNPAVYVLNIFFNMIQICLPMTLIKHGMVQTFFAIYQILFSFKLMQKFLIEIKKKEKTNSKISVCILMAFIIVSAIFEPDYGSLGRHEIVFFPIMCIAFWEDERRIKG